MRCRTALLTIIATAMLSGVGARAAETGPDPRIKQLQILDQSAGEWTLTQPGSKRRGSVTSEWILKGRVLQTRYRLTDGQELLILRTYDPSLRKYVVTAWGSQGMSLMLFGEWDQQTKTLSASGDGGNLTMSIAFQFINENTEEWQIQIANAAGKTVRQIRGTNQREQP